MTVSESSNSLIRENFLYWANARIPKNGILSPRRNLLIYVIYGMRWTKIILKISATFRTNIGNNNFIRDLDNSFDNAFETMTVEGNKIEIAKQTIK